jgi:hypothetical protein
VVLRGATSCIRLVTVDKPKAAWVGGGPPRPTQTDSLWERTPLPQGIGRLWQWRKALARGHGAVTNGLSEQHMMRSGRLGIPWKDGHVHDLHSGDFYGCRVGCDSRKYSGVLY